MLHFITATGTTQPDYIALAMVVALMLVVVGMVLRKCFGSPKTQKPEAVTAPAAEPAPQPTAPGSAGQLKIHDVEPKTAAMIMAIVAHKTGKPLNELRFLSIKEVK